MLISRVISSAFLIALAVGVLVGDYYLAPWYPCLLVAAVLLAGLAARELVTFFPGPARPPAEIAVGGAVLVIVANWVNPPGGLLAAWVPVLFAFVGVFLIAFLRELYFFHEPGTSTPRLANTTFVVAYLGVLPSFVVRLRWIGADSGIALALTIFVPKLGDVGAYFTGRFFGRHRMTPTLSPKKTWEGFAGGILVSVITAVVLSFWTDSLSVPFAVGFGLTVGLAGVLGDLAESLLKRDAGAKDAARSVPGFGGVLDVIDSILLAGPVAYLWFLLAAR